MKLRILASQLSFAIAMAGVSVAAYAETPRLFAPEPFPTEDTEVVRAQYNAQDPSLGSLQWRRVHSSLLDENTQELELEVAPGKSFIATAQFVRRNDDGTLVWSASLRPTHPATAQLGYAVGATYDAANHVLLVRNGDKITGNIVADGQEYRLRPRPDGGHTIVEVDEHMRPVLEHDDAVLFSPSDMPGLPISMNAQTATAAATIRVLIAYGAEAERRTGDYHGLANLAIARANQGFRNSGIDITFELANVVLMRQEETRDIGRDLGLLAGKNDGFMDYIHQARNDSRADIVTLVSGNSGGCGIGYLNANESGAFNVVDFNCFQGDNVFAHEAGHNMGAHHDPVTANGRGAAYSYGYGFQNTAIRQRTVMAYDCSGGCAWAAAWSSPNVYIGGHAMGNAWQSDNRRVLLERKHTVAAFR